MLLYQFLSSFFPYSIICGVIGITIMIIKKVTDHLQGENVYILAYTLMLIFIVTFYSTIPSLLATETFSISFLAIVILGILLFFGLLALFDFDHNILIWLAHLIIYIICCITYSIVLRPTLVNMIKVETREFMVNEPEKYDLCIFEDIRLNNVPSNVTEAIKENNKEDEDNIISYWYLTNNNEALYASVDALNSVLLAQEENSIPYVEVQNYITIDYCKFTKLKKITQKRQAFVFHLPNSLVGIVN